MKMYTLLVMLSVVVSCAMSLALDTEHGPPGTTLYDTEQPSQVTDKKLPEEHERPKRTLLLGKALGIGLAAKALFAGGIGLGYARGFGYGGGFGGGYGRGFYGGYGGYGYGGYGGGYGGYGGYYGPYRSYPRRYYISNGWW